MTSNSGGLRHHGTGACAIGILTMTLAFAPTAIADDGGWQHRSTLYGWLAGIDGQTRFPIDDPVPVEIDASDIIDSLKMVFMGNYEGHRDRWSMLADVVYLDLGNSRTVDTTLGDVTAGLDLTSWIVHGMAGLEISASLRNTAHLVAGLRYLSLDGELDLRLGGGHGRSTSESESLTDAVVGVRGRLALGERWFVPYHADLGGGGSDYSYQLFAGLGYEAGTLDFALGYRHLYFDLGNDRFMRELQVSGPALGVGFRF